MKYIKYRNLVVKYIGEANLVESLDGKSVLGKGKIKIIENWCGVYDYTLEFVESDDERIEYKENHIIVSDRIEKIKNTTIIQSILFMLYQKRNVKENTIALHASAVLKGDELIIFTGGKGSGKTSMSYILAMKYDDIKLVANDYIEIKINSDNTYTIVFSDYSSEITFRSHVLYNMDRELYKKLMDTEEYVFNQYVKGTANFVDLSRSSIKCNKLRIYYVGMGKTGKFEVSHKNGAALMIEVYKELTQYIRGKSVVGIDSDRKKISNQYIDGDYFFGEKEADVLLPLIEKICNSENAEIEWIRGQGCDIEEYVLRR